MAKRRTHLEIEMDIRKIIKYSILGKDRICTMQELADLLKISKNQLLYTLKVMKNQSAQQGEELKDSVKRLESNLRRGKTQTISFPNQTTLGMVYGQPKLTGLFLKPVPLDFVIVQGPFIPNKRDIIYVVEEKSRQKFDDVKLEVKQYLVLDFLYQEDLMKLEVLQMDQYVVNSVAELQKKLGRRF